jgi:hypothetical protein
MADLTEIQERSLWADGGALRVLSGKPLAEIELVAPDDPQDEHHRETRHGGSPYVPPPNSRCQHSGQNT